MGSTTAIHTTGCRYVILSGVSPQPQCLFQNSPVFIFPPSLCQNSPDPLILILYATHIRAEATGLRTRRRDMVAMTSCPTRSLNVRLPLVACRRECCS